MERPHHDRDAPRVIQLLLASLTLTAFVLSTSRVEAYRRIGPLVGLPAQALWIISIDWPAQWGIGLVTLVYLARYLQLAYVAWIRPARR